MKTQTSRTPAARNARRIVRQYLAVATLVNSDVGNNDRNEKLFSEFLNLRDSVLPRLEKKLPSALQTLARSAK
jgi:hypothetical protein